MRGGANSRNGRCEQSPAACVGMLTLRIPSCASVAFSRRTSSSSTSTSTEPSWSPWPKCTLRASSSPGSGGARPLRRAACHRRQVHGDARRARGGVPRGPPSALHGAFLLQRAGKGSCDQTVGRGARAEGNPRVGIARGMRQKGRGGGGEAGVDAARSSRENGARRVRRNADLHGIPA